MQLEISHSNSEKNAEKRLILNYIILHLLEGKKIKRKRQVQN